MITYKEQMLNSTTAAETETKERILAAAMTVFEEKGYHLATMAEIAEAANVGKGTLYWHFASKDDLFAGMVEAFTQSINLKLRSVLEAKDRPFPDLLLAFTRECLAFSDSHRQLVRHFMSVPQGLSEEFRRKMLQWRVQFLAINTQLIQVGLETGYFRPDLEVERVVTAYTGMLFAFGGRQLWKEGGNHVDAEADFIKNLLFNGIANKSEGDRDGEGKS